MSFDLPDLTSLFVAFFAVAAVAAVVTVGALVSFFAENRPARVRRQQSVGHYYGHLVLGH